MNRGLISKILIAVIVIATAQGIFWFFKTSAIKKEIVSRINSSGGKANAAEVSVAGFPLKQKILINDLKFELSDSDKQLNLPNKYQVNIKQIEAISSIFSNDFKVTSFKEISFQDVNGNVGTVEFNKDPEINFLVVNKKISKFSYQDAGYRILDNNKNVLFESGTSRVDFESIPEKEDVTRNKIKAEFKDINGIDLFNAQKLAGFDGATPPAVVQNNLDSAAPVSPATPTDSAANPANASAPATVPNVTENSTLVNNNATAPAPNSDPNAPTTPDSVVAPSPTGTTLTQDNSPKTIPNVDIANNNLTKKTIYLELEYITAPKKADNAAAPKPEDPTAIALPDLGEKNIAVSSISIKNFEFTAPLYKINIVGELINEEKGFPSGSLTVKVEKFDNLLTYLKKFTSLVNSDNKIAPESTASVAAANNNQVSQAGIASSVETLPVVSGSESSTSPNPNKKPEDAATVLTNLAKKNVATSNDIAVFDFKREKGKDLTINDTSIIEIMGQLYLSALGSPTINQKTDATQ